MFSTRLHKQVGDVKYEVSASKDYYRFSALGKTGVYERARYTLDEAFYAFEKKIKNFVHKS